MKAKFYSDTTKAGIKMVIATDTDDEAFVLAQFIREAHNGRIVTDEYHVALPSRDQSRNDSVGAYLTLRVVTDDAELNERTKR